MEGIPQNCTAAKTHTQKKSKARFGVQLPQMVQSKEDIFSEQTMDDWGTYSQRGGWGGCHISTVESQL